MNSPLIKSLLHTKTGIALLLCALATALLLFLATLASWIYFPVALMLFASAIVFLVGLLLLIYYRLNVDFAVHQEANNHLIYQQSAALQQLLTLIKLRLPLPPMRMGAASPDVLLLLCNIILKKRPQTVVECGAGVSTLVQGYLLEKLGYGKLYTLEHDFLWAERVTRWVTDHQLDDYVTIIYAPLTEQIVDGNTVYWYDADRVQPLLKTLPPIDFLFVDGPPGDISDTRVPAVPIMQMKLAPDAQIILDDTARLYERRAAEKWAKLLDYELEFINNEKGAGWLQPHSKAISSTLS